MIPFKQPVLLILVVLASLGMVGGALLYRNKNSAVPAPLAAIDNNSTLRIFTTSELATYNGQSGAKCYVAVNTKVYEIEQKLLWKDGQHTTSNGKASCGRDLSEVIKQSPHGTSKLQQLTVVGTLASE